MENLKRIEEISAYPPMKFIDEDQFRNEKNRVRNNITLSCCYEYTEKWAQLMQKRISDGYKLKNIYKETSDEVDCLYGYVTGPMYSDIKLLMMRHWINGNELLRLFKKDQLSIWNPLRWFI